MNVKINEWWNLLRCLESTEEKNPRASTNMDTGQSLHLGKIMDFLYLFTQRSMHQDSLLAQEQIHRSLSITSLRHQCKRTLSGLHNDPKTQLFNSDAQLMRRRFVDHNTKKKLK
jgi:hypothetical protein